MLIKNVGMSNVTLELTIYLGLISPGGPHSYIRLVVTQLFLN